MHARKLYYFIFYNSLTRDYGSHCYVPFGCKLIKLAKIYTVNDETLAGLKFGKSAEKSIWQKKVR